MEDNHLNYQKVKIKYLNFIRSQEVMSEPFRDKLQQLNKFYLPISKMISDDYFKKKKTKLIGLSGGQGTGKSTISKPAYRRRRASRKTWLSTPLRRQGLSTRATAVQQRRCRSISGSS